MAIKKRGPSGPPKAFGDFSQQFPLLADAWAQLRQAESVGPLDIKTQRLVKLAVSLGAGLEGATHSSARKALAAGASADELFQVVALCASNIGLPAAVRSFTWVRDVTDAKRRR